MIQLILRTKTSPFGDITKGSVLSVEELDENQIKLKGELIYTATSQNNNISLKKINGEDISLELSGITDTFLTGGTYSAGTAVFTNNTGGTFSVSGFSTSDSFGVLNASSSLPYPEIVDDITIISSSIPNQRVSLPVNASIGDTLRISVSGSFSTIIAAGLGSVIYTNGISDTTSTRLELTVNPKEEYLFVRRSNGVWSSYRQFAKMPLNYSFRLFQTGTGEPNPNDVYDNLRINPFDGSQAVYRDVFFERLGVGSYRLNLLSKEPATGTDFDKMVITFGDGSVRLDPSFNNTTIGGISYRQYTFKTYDLTGTLADDLLTGVFCTITLYP
jgi:hypothetical protein